VRQRATSATIAGLLITVDEAAELDCRGVQFIGGEPTMHPRLDDFVDHANRRGFAFIEVFTKATRLDKELLGTAAVLV
jgi:uncharacterized radical SAM superfamily Fe-S cluster-containing enzyme